MEAKEFEVKTTKSFAFSNSSQDGQYRNLSLNNSTHECSAPANLVSSKSIFNKNEKTGKKEDCSLKNQPIFYKEKITNLIETAIRTKISDFSESSKQKSNVKLLNERKKDLTTQKFLTTFQNSEKESQKQWKKEDSRSATKSSSTLSLHIAAYEDSVIENGNQTNSKKEESPPLFSDSFEFPRQQEDDRVGESEIMQFKASQKLFNPNETNSPGNNIVGNDERAIVDGTRTCSTPPPATPSQAPPSTPSSILMSHDGSFRLDLSSLNLTPQDLATITAAFNSTINSSTPTPTTISSTSPSTMNSTILSSSTPEYVMKQTPKTRRQRAKHSIVPTEILILPENVPGTFLNLTPSQFDEMVSDNETALAFAAKVGLIQNIRKCPKCEREMALCKFNNSCGYRWVCRRTEMGKRFTCSVRGMRKDTILDDRLVGILTMLRIMYHFSKNVSDTDIISRLDIGHVRSARTILSRLREMVDEEVLKLSEDPALSAEQLRQHFLISEGIDHFGFILFWGSRFKIVKSSTNPEESSLLEEMEGEETKEGVKDEFLNQMEEINDGSSGGNNDATEVGVKVEVQEEESAGTNANEIVIEKKDDE